MQMETRPPNIEGGGDIPAGTRPQLAADAAGPDIVGEVRGPEAFDMMQAMNTGHDGSMSTIHSNSPRDALFRLENMILMANLSLPLPAIRTQIASALNLLVHSRADARRRSPCYRGYGGRGTGRGGDHPRLVVHVQIRGEKPGWQSQRSLRADTGPAAFFLPRLEYFGLGYAFLQTLGVQEKTIGG